MEDKFVKLFNEYDFHIALGMVIDIHTFFGERGDIQDYKLNIEESGKKIYIYVKLRNFSKWFAQKMFSEFVCTEGYDNVNLYMCDYNGQQVRYLYLTIAQDYVGAKMEVVIE